MEKEAIQISNSYSGLTIVLIVEPELFAQVIGKAQAPTGDVASEDSLRIRLQPILKLLITTIHVALQGNRVTYRALSILDAKMAEALMLVGHIIDLAQQKPSTQSK